MKNTDTFIFMGEKMYEFAEMLKERMEAEEAGKIEYVINELRYAQVSKAYKAIRAFILSENPKAKVSLQARQFAGTIMDICIETDEISVFDIPAFQQALQDASNFEIHPTLDETVVATIAFNDVAMVRKRK